MKASIAAEKAGAASEKFTEGKKRRNSAIENNDDGHLFVCGAQLLGHFECDYAAETPTPKVIGARGLNPSHFLNIMGRHLFDAGMWGLLTIKTDSLHSIHRLVVTDPVTEMAKANHWTAETVNAEERGLEPCGWIRTMHRLGRASEEAIRASQVHNGGRLEKRCYRKINKQERLDPCYQPHCGEGMAA